MPATGLARALSKLGHCSRSEGGRLVLAGRVRLNGRICRNPEQQVQLGRDRVEVDDAPVAAREKVYLALNKPRGLVTSARDEQGRDTVFTLLADAGLPPLSAVGRLDKASEGLLLFSNDHAWAHHLTDPQSHQPKTYHVQVGGAVTAEHLAAFARGIEDAGEPLRLPKTRLLRHGSKNTWLEIVLTEGRNRHIRRVLAAFDLEVLRLIRIAIGPLTLGELTKGQWRHLTTGEVRQLAELNV
jgi:23S rRNA pseudouridine2605 synthase